MPHGRRLEDADARDPEERRRYLRRGQGLTGQESAREQQEPDGEGGEEHRRQSGSDPLLAGEEQGVGRTDLQQADGRDADPVGSSQSGEARASREGQEHRRRERHARRREGERRQIAQAELDEQPGRAPQEAAEDVGEEQAHGGDQLQA